MDVAIMQRLGFEVEHLEYSAPAVWVYFGKSGGWPVVFKVQSHQPEVDYREVEKECAVMQNLQHSNIVRLYDYKWVQTDIGHCFVMTLERCEKDLAKDVKQRKTNSHFFEEAMLWEYAQVLIRTLAWLQGQKIAHRDLKPENIFLLQGCLKLGDFGSARFMQAGQSMATMTGTPLYLSPRLRAGFSNHRAHVDHNVYKSDVYSLGITLFVLALLDPTPLINPSDANLRAALSTIRYSDNFKQLIGLMITQDEANRPDFVQLLQWIAPAPAPAVYEAYSPTPAGSSASHQDPYETMPATASSSASSQDPSKTLGSVPRPAPPKTGPSQVVEEEKKAAPASPRRAPQQKPRGAFSCQGCGKPLDRGDLTPTNCVQLFCEPYEHIFCSANCFQAFIQASHRECPSCRQPISQDNIDQYICPPSALRRTIVRALLCLQILLLPLMLLWTMVKKATNLVKKRQ